MGELWVWCGYPMVGVAVWKVNGRMEEWRREDGQVEKGGRVSWDGKEDEGG